MNDQQREQANQWRNDTEKWCREIAEVDPKQLLRVELGEINFAALKDTFERIVAFCGLLNEVNLGEQPPQALKQCFGAFQALHRFVGEIQAFSVAADPQGAPGKRDQLVDQVEAAYFNLWRHCAPLLYFRNAVYNPPEKLSQLQKANLERINELAAAQSKAAERVLAEARADVQQALQSAVQEVGERAGELRQELSTRMDAQRSELADIRDAISSDIGEVRKKAEGHARAVEQVLKDLGARRDEANQALKAINDARTQIIVGKYGEVFKKEADEQVKTSRWWLYATIGTSVFTTALAGAALVFHLLHPMGVDYPLSQAVQVSVIQLSILSVLYYGILLCGKNYKACRHNATVNRHRQHALDTFEDFAKSADKDPKVLNAVLLQTTQTIFCQQTTGYIEASDDGKAPTQILELINQAGGGS